MHPIITALALISCTLSVISCDEEPRKIPTVVTAPVTNISFNTASTGGSIMADGNSQIKASGVVYSSSNDAPTIADDKVEGVAIKNTFTCELVGLTSGTTYYARAYAMNGVGIGYGNAVSFTTGNAAPTADNVVVTGDVQIGGVLTVTYIYADAENDVESGTIIQWYSANDAAGSGETAIEGASKPSYTISAGDEYRFIRASVMPKAATGTPVGIEVKSPLTSQVPEATETVTFIYNGEAVTYGVIVSPKTGRKWLDRNLGAQRAAVASDDYLAYGDLFQWGRAADNHQLINWADSETGSPVAGTTTELSNSDDPDNGGLFILKATTPFDWREPRNDVLWQGADGINNPCPSGWRIPTSTEWGAESIDVISTGFIQLKLTGAGSRSGANGNLSSIGTGHYWSSTTNEHRAMYYVYRPTLITDVMLFGQRRSGYSCRCTKD